MERRGDLLGRGAESAVLRRWVAAARAGHGRLALVSGDAGVGKTALVARTLRGSSMRVLWGAATERGTAPLAPVIEAVRAHPGWPARVAAALDAGWLQVLSALLPELAGRTSRHGRREAAPVPGDRGDESGTWAGAISALLAAMARIEPLVVVLDDLQW